MLWFWIFYIHVCGQISAAEGWQEDDASDEESTPEPQNSEHVYRVENRSISKILRDSQRLCLNKFKNKITTCGKDPEINFLCLGAIWGRVDSCEDLNRNEFVIPLCVKETFSSVMTCGKFSTGPVCAINATATGMCEISSGQKLCLTKRGKLVNCKKLNSNDSSSEHNKGRTDTISEHNKGAPKTQGRQVHSDEEQQTEENKGDTYSSDYDDDYEGGIFDNEGGPEAYDDGVKMPGDPSEEETKSDNYDIGKSSSEKEELVPAKRRHTRANNYNDQGYEEDEIDREIVLTEGTDDDMPDSKMVDGSENIQVENKATRMIAEIHARNTHLCKSTSKSEELVNCDKDTKIRFACIGAKSRKINPCKEFKKFEVALPICYQEKNKYLMTCDIISNVNLCLSGKDPIYPCQNKNYYACLGDDGTPSECPVVLSPDVVKHPDNEKFYHLYCSNCTIANKMVVVGTPEDVLPETEFFTFPSV